MKFGVAVCGAFVVGAALALVAAAPWQDAKAKDKPAAGGAPAGMSAEDMAMWTKLATPGPEQAEMAKNVGKWTVATEWIMAPGAPPMTSTGTSEFKMMFDGRYMVQDHSSTGAMGPFQGMGITAFDNATGKYEDVWCDNMGTGIMYSTGEKKGDTLTFNGEMFDPKTKSMTKLRYDIKHASPNEFTMEMYATESGKPEFKMMTLKYTRAAAPGGR